MPKNLIIDTLHHKPTKRPPWVVFSGVHAGKLAGFSAEEVLKDGDKLLKSLQEVAKIYDPDGMPIVFDLQIEAEILGCELRWVHDSPPMVATHPLSNEKKVPCDCTIITKQDGRLPMILDVMRQARVLFEDIALYGLICGPFTLASHLRGTNIFIDMYEDPQYVKDLLAYCIKINQALTSMYIEAGMDVIAVVDPLVSQISTNHFNEFLSEPFTQLFTFIREQQSLSSFFVCGDATKNIEAMCLTYPDSISIDENIDIKQAKKITDDYNIAIGGNIQLTVTMLHGSQDDNMKAVVDIVDACTPYNLIIAPGCDMPYDVPIENPIAISQAVKNIEATKSYLRNITQPEVKNLDVNIPDYQSLSKPLIEVFTLDSATCAACSYMMHVVNELNAEYPELFDVIEYKFTKVENIARTKKMGVKNLPSMLLNGKLIYSSIIPSKHELLKLLKKDD
jgi:uroporphyrinogen decarboxylase